MKIKLLERIAIFTWIALVFYWALYTNIPKRTIEYLIKTLPLILLGICSINLIFKKHKQKK